MKIPLKRMKTTPICCSCGVFLKEKCKLSNTLLEASSPKFFDNFTGRFRRRRSGRRITRCNSLNRTQLVIQLQTLWTITSRCPQTPSHVTIEIFFAELEIEKLRVVKQSYH